MNILQISTYDNVGGAARIAWELKTHIKQFKHHQSMFVGKKFSNDKTVHKIPQNPLNSYLAKLFATDIDFYNSDYILGTKEYKNANIIHCHNLHGYYFRLNTLSKIFPSKPIVWTLHDMWAITPHCAHSFSQKPVDGFYQCANKGIYPAIAWHNEKYLMNEKNKIYHQTKLNIVVPSLWLKEKVLNSVMKTKNITVIHNGIDNHIFKQYNQHFSRIRLNLPLNKKIIMFISDGGQHNLWKGWQYAKAVADYYTDDNNVMFLCIGGFPQDSITKDLNILYIPYVIDQRILAQYYSASNIFLFTSIAENFPLVTLEAMSCGIPVVSFDVGGVKEAVIHKNNGYIAKYQDVEDLICGVNYILGLSKKKVQNMSNSSTARINRYFTSRIMCKKYIKLYLSLVK